RRETEVACSTANCGAAPSHNPIECRRKSSGQHSYIVKSIEQTSSGFEEYAQVRLMVLVVLATAALFLPSLISPATAVANAPAGIRILFDFGDGTYRWANATVEDPAAVNATWYAVQATAMSGGTWISWTWYRGSVGFGMLITDSGDMLYTPGRLQIP